MAPLQFWPKLSNFWIFRPFLSKSKCSQMSFEISWNSQNSGQPTVISRKSLIRDLFIKKCVCRHGKDGIYLNERTCFWGKRSYERGKKTASINNLRDRGYLPRSLLHLLKRGYVDLITIEQVMGTLYIHRSPKKKLYILQP